MSFASAAVDKLTVVLVADPNTLFVTFEIVGKVIVLPPVPSCVKTIVP